MGKMVAPFLYLYEKGVVHLGIDKTTYLWLGCEAREFHFRGRRADSIEVGVLRLGSVNAASEWPLHLPANEMCISAAAYEKQRHPPVHLCGNRVFQPPLGSSSTSVAIRTGEQGLQPLNDASLQSIQQATREFQLTSPPEAPHLSPVYVTNHPVNEDAQMHSC